MSYQADFHAKTSPLLEKEQELKESDQECGERWQGLLARYDPNTHSLRTVQCSLIEDLEQSLQTWPKWGLMQDGVCWEQPTLVPRIKETVYGFLLPTPTASDGTTGSVIGKNDNFYTTKTGMPRKINQNGKDGSVGLGRLVQMWPTPRSCSAMAATITPESAWNPARNPNLETIVGRTMWPTPTAHNAKETNAPSESNRNTPTLASQDGGKLNPIFVEWLMGWPLGWTDLKPLGMDKFHCAPQQHGES